jgi:UDP-N-acetylglucosamine--N-acetylmuramyl-(pentapeptide) pyrophosphoryl-undecaprenol N-acetylglucosamine transferase
MKQLRVLIAAGGTGGHIFPALQIARAFKEWGAGGGDEAVRVEFIGSGRPLEQQVIESAGFIRHEIPIVGLKSRGFSGLFEFLVLLPGAFFKIWRLISEFKPDLILGVGGYVSVLPVSAAYLRAIPTWIHEAELKPGLANFWLSLIADKVSVAFDRAELPFWSKRIYTGHPLRDGLKEVRDGGRELGSPPCVLIVGGSQGAKALDQALIELRGYLRENGILICHQCRADDQADLEKAYREGEVKARVMPFIEEMPAAYDWCDIVISRAGAGAVMELGVVNKPAILVPYPFAQGGHQSANAKTLSDYGKALLVEEGPEFAKRLKDALEQLLDSRFHAAMRARPFDACSTEAAREIVRGCLERIGINPDHFFHSC